MSKRKIEKERFEVGELVVLSEGEYSDYAIRALFRVVKNFEPEPLFERWFTDVPISPYGYVMFEESDWAAYLLQEGYVEKMQYVEWHFVGYGDKPDIEIKVHE